MRLVEFNNSIPTLVGLVSHLKRKAEGKESARVRTKSFLKMLHNLGVSMDVNALNNLLGGGAVSNLISSADDEWVELNMTGDAPLDDEPLDLGMDDTGGEEDMDLDLGGDEDMGMGAEEPAGATTDEFEQPEMGGAPAAQSPQQKVQNMAKSALSRRQ